jgi:hypothetical protein
MHHQANKIDCATFQCPFDPEFVFHSENEYLESQYLREHIPEVEVEGVSMGSLHVPPDR